jgi:hypothetical protein
MKTQHVSLLASGFAAAMLSSCGPTPDTHTETSVTTTSYQPGYRLASLPSGYRSEVISGNSYYYHNGAYYRRDTNGYVVVDAPRESRYYSEGQRGGGGVTVVTQLPAGYRVVRNGGNEYYQSGEVYYRRQGSGYIVVSRPN